MNTPSIKVHKRKPFWSEAVYSQTGSVIPLRVRKGKEKMKWSTNNIVGELLREPIFCKHVQIPQPPVSIFGLSLAELRQRETMLYAKAAECFEEYRRGGKLLKRRQKRSVPILLVAVSSWPIPEMKRTVERDRWEKLVIDAAKTRWGDKLRSVVAHVDETFYHLHLVVDDDGRPVKPLHAGFARSTAPELKRAPRPDRARAYREGARAVQAWFYENVGKQLDWVRSDVPRPRFSRAEAQRNRQAELEQREIAVAYSLEQKRLDDAARLIADIELAQAAVAHQREVAEHLCMKNEFADEMAAARLEAADTHQREVDDLRSQKSAFEDERAAERQHAIDVVKRLNLMAAAIKDQVALDAALKGPDIDVEALTQKVRARARNA